MLFMTYLPSNQNLVCCFFCTETRTKNATVWESCEQCVKSSCVKSLSPPNGAQWVVKRVMLGLTLLIMFMSVADMLAGCCAVGRWTAFLPAAAPGFYAPERHAAALCVGAPSQHGHKASLKGLTMSTPACVWGLLLPSSVAAQNNTPVCIFTL